MFENQSLPHPMPSKTETALNITTKPGASTESGRERMIDFLFSTINHFYLLISFTTNSRKFSLSIVIPVAW
jgi:hypothetical protein